MKYCTYCGQELPDNAKFCSSCGSSINDKQDSGRKTAFDGTIYKCPNCGQVLNSFTGNCPSCGYELRDVHSSNSVKELCSKLEEIEKNRRPSTKPKTLRETIIAKSIGNTVDETDEKKINLIQNFPIPNTKEDLFEFIILSKSNIDIDAYDGLSGDNSRTAREAISNAWKSKFEQAYEKSKILFKNENDKLNEIKLMHKSINKQIKKSKSRIWKFIVIIFCFLILFIVFEFVAIFKMDEKDKEDTLSKLTNLENQIQDCLENEDYELALVNAQNLTFNISDSSLKNEWTNKQEYWINKIISEAEKDGIVLENPLIKTLPQISWIDNVFTSLIPIPDSEYGEFINETEKKCEIKIYNFSESDFAEYKEYCKSKGFSNVFSNSSNYFEA